MQTAPSHLLTLSGVDLAIIVLYFFSVLGIGFYLKKYTKTGEDFFLAGREMTAWVAGLSFLAANLGSLELMGWAGAARNIRWGSPPGLRRTPWSDTSKSVAPPRPPHRMAFSRSFQARRASLDIV